MLSQDIKNTEENAARDHGDDECDEDEYSVSITFSWEYTCWNLYGFNKEAIAKGFKMVT